MHRLGARKVVSVIGLMRRSRADLSGRLGRGREGGGGGGGGGSGSGSGGGERRRRRRRDERHRRRGGGGGIGGGAWRWHWQWRWRRRRRWSCYSVNTASNGQARTTQHIEFYSKGISTRYMFLLFTVRCSRRTITYNVNNREDTERTVHSATVGLKPARSHALSLF